MNTTYILSLKKRNRGQLLWLLVSVLLISISLSYGQANLIDHHDRNRENLVKGSNNIVNYDAENVWGELTSEVIIVPDIDKQTESGMNFDNSSITSQGLGGYNLQSSNNSVELEQIEVGHVYGGHTLLHIKTGETKAGPSTGHSRAEGVITIDNDSKLSANGNQVNILDTANILGDIYGGQASLNLETGDAVSSTVDSSNEGAGYTTSSTFITLGAGFESTASNNIVVINSALTSNSIISGGDISIQLHSGQAGKEGYGNIINSSAAADVNGIAQSYSNIIAERLTSSSIGNSVAMNNSDSSLSEGYGGRVTVLTHSGDVRSGDVTLTNSNSTYSKAATYTNSYIVMPDAKVSSEGNTLQVAGNAKNLYGGSVQFSAISGNATAGNVENAGQQSYRVDTNANANINVTNLNVALQNNKVELRGTADNVIGGQASITLQSGEAKAGVIKTKLATQGCPEKDCLKAYAYSEINATNGKIKADSNTVIIDTTASVKEVKGGDVAFSAKGGKATSGSFNFVGREDLTENQIDSSATINVSNTQLSVNYNTVNFNGALQEQGVIFGGHIFFSLEKGEAWRADGSEGRYDINNNGTVAKATDNTVNLGDNAKVTAGNQLYGGFLVVNGEYSPDSYDLFTGNTLNVTSKETLTFKDVGNFENYNFTLNPIFSNTNQAIIQTENIYFGSNSSNFSSEELKASVIHVVGIHSSDKILSEGDQFILIQAGNGKLEGDATAGIDHVTQVQQGISLLYDVETIVDKENDRVITTIKKAPNNGGIKPLPQLKSLHEGRMSILQLLLRGADNLANIIGQQDFVEGYVPFADLYAGHSKYSSDSTIRANEYLLTAGAAFQFNQWALAPVLEMGWSDYKGASNYLGHLRSSGDNRYYGAGLLWRYDAENRLYAEGSFRIGRAHNEFESKDLMHAATGERANYDIRGTYYGAHIGLGYLAEIDSANIIDFNAQFLWTKLQGKSLRVVGDPIDFDDMNSKRIRVGLEWKHKANERFNMRAGVTYEYEFSDRDGLTTYHQFNVDGLSLKGSTGIVSFGATLKPSDRSRWSYDVDVMGYAGKRKGAALNVKTNYEF